MIKSQNGVVLREQQLGEARRAPQVKPTTIVVIRHRKAKNQENPDDRERKTNRTQKGNQIETRTQMTESSLFSSLLWVFLKSVLGFKE